MPFNENRAHRYGDVVALRYITTDGRIDMCWPCRVVEDSSDLLALFIATGSPYKAGPKLTAQQKRAAPRRDVPPEQRRVAPRHATAHVPGALPFRVALLE